MKGNIEDVRDAYKGKKIAIDDLPEIIAPGNRIFLSSGPATPVKTVNGILNSDNPGMQDLEIIQLITMGDYLRSDTPNSYKYRLRTFNVGESITRDVEQGKVDFIPAHLVEIPFIFSSGAIGVDVAIIQVSPPDHRGFMSLGIAIDVANIVIKNASVVIAEVNPFVPVTYGETSIHINQVNHIIESDLPLLERNQKKYDDIIDRIGWHISNLIDDGSTVALHVGRLFDSVAAHLVSKNNLKIYSHIISDWVMNLVESGALSMDRGMRNISPVSTSYCYGSRALYDYVSRNPMFEFMPLNRLTFPTSLYRIPKLVSVMNVKKIDLSGESVVFHSGDNLISGYESKLNFAVGAAFSRGGKAIVALRSLDQFGNSNIMVKPSESFEQIRSTLGVTRYVITEYGVASLFGKSIRERALAMIDVAHPNHRERLLEDAKDAGYVYQDQVYRLDNALHYPVSLETVKTFKDGMEVRFRPIKHSDEDMMRRLFYNFSDESKYLRYFARIHIMPHKQMQEYVNIDYDQSLSIVGIVQQKGAERIIAEARYAFDERDSVYEMAFIVDEEYQGFGIATFLLKYLLKIGRERGIAKMTANVLPQNDAMKHVFEKAGVPFNRKFDEGVIRFEFEPAVEDIVI